jgi:hypothetical protein
MTTRVPHLTRRVELLRKYDEAYSSCKSAIADAELLIGEVSPVNSVVQHE